MDRKIGGMTLRELLGLSLLVVLLAAGLASAWHQQRQAEAVAIQLEDSAWLALSGQWENARDLYQTARQQWQRGWKLRSALAHQAVLGAIDDQFAQLGVCAAAGEQTEFARLSMSLARQLSTLSQDQRLTWWNIL